MSDGPPPHWTGDLLDADLPAAASGGTVDGASGTAESEWLDGPARRPLQLPRVGWGEGDDDNRDRGDTGGGDGAAVPTSPTLSPPSSPVRDDGGGVVSRRAPRVPDGGSVGGSVAGSDLAPIPEDFSMHGAWPDYFINQCYDYDERKKYRYERCPHFWRRFCILALVVVGVIVGARGYGRLAGNHRQQLPKDKDAGVDEILLNEKDDDNASEDGHIWPENDDDVYRVVAETLRPLTFDSSSVSWDGTYFHAFEFCGSEFSRVPCPYIAYCPLGPGHAPLGGTRIGFDGSSSWAPVFDRHRDKELEMQDWVQLGTGGTCQLWSKLFPGKGPPPWGGMEWDGGSRDGMIARHVMCCLESVDGVYVEGETAIGTSIAGKAGTQGRVEETLRNPDDPDRLDRPPMLEEDEAEKPIPVEVKGDSDGG